MATSERQQARDRFEARLARALLQRGLLTSEDLEEAIHQQIIMGGHLSTNIWELGYVDGGVLSRLSAQLLAIQEPDPIETAEIPHPILARLPLHLVERKRILPVGIVRVRLRVATCEPWDHLALGEAAFYAGYPVEPVFVAEVPLVRALSRLYRLPLSARFRLDPPRLLPPVEVQQAASEPAQVPWEELEELPAEIATVVLTPAPPTVIDAPEEEVTHEEERALEPIADFDAAVRILEAAEDRDTIGETLVRFALSHGKRVALLIRRGAQWSGWIGAGVGVEPDRVRRFIALAEPGTLFGLVAATRAHYIGPLAEHESHKAFVAALGQGWPRTVALFPVHFGAKVVMAIYLDAGDGRRAPTDIADILVLAQRAPAALARLARQRLARGQQA